MAYFTQPSESGVTPGRVAPLSAERIAAALDSQNWRYETDDDGDLSGSWDGHMFYFLRMGQDKEIFMVRGRWEARPSLDLNPQIMQLLNTWHREHLFPKAVLVDFPEDGNSRVFTEVTIDCEHGVTDQQLLLHIGAGINTSLSLFKELNSTFPGFQDADEE
ncbi:MAG: YbjN domain-containing protein [Propionibacteriaceae bacterium]|nr:YbjN domain-containing protein [Propionibacteriaceae bacterium]